MTSAAVCAEGFCKKGSAAECAALGCWEGLQVSVQLWVVEKICSWVCRSELCVCKVLNINVVLWTYPLHSGWTMHILCCGGSFMMLSWCEEAKAYFGFKVKSQLSAWMTSAAECAEGFCKKVKSQLSAWTTSAAECVEGFCKKVKSQLSAWMTSAAECTA